MNRITLALESAPDGTVRVTANLPGGPSEHLVTGADARAIETQGQALLGGFEAGARPLADPVALTELGARLKSAFFGPYEAAINAAFANGEGRLLVASRDAALLNLPWELLPGANDHFLVEDGRWAIRRSTRADLAASSALRVARPLRILFSASAPQGLANLDFEKEEEAILRIAGHLGGKVYLDIAEAGTFEELQNLISELKPHVVHLSGHGVLKNGVGLFCFEDERGRPDERDGPQMAERIFAGSGVRLVFVSGCQTAQAGVAGLCQSLTATGHVPLAMGWGASIGDERATEFARIFYHELAAGRPADRAVSTARRALFEQGRVRAGQLELLDASFALPQIYAGEDADELIDEKRAGEPPERPGVRYELLGDNIRGLREGFVGRRRLLQRTRPAFRSGDKTIVLLTGIGGAGKSTLATRLANRCKHEGWRLVAVQARRDEAPLFCQSLLGEIAAACQRMGRYGDEQMLRDGQRPIADRLRLAVEVLNEAKILLVLDNLEALMPLPPAAPAWSDPNVSSFFRELASRLTGEGRAILTCRYRAEGFDPSAQNILHEHLPDFTEADFSKYLRRHTKVAERIAKRELSEDLLGLFYRKLGGTPRFVEQASSILGSIDPNRLRQLLEGIDNPTLAGESDEIRALQQRFFEDLFLPDLYQSLAAPLRAALSRLAVVTVPLPSDGVASVAGLGESDTIAAIRRWQTLSLLQQFGESDEVPLFAVYPLQREFLTGDDRLPPPAAQAAHTASAAFFRECFQKNREQELRLSISAELLACLHHANACGDVDRRRWATVTLAQGLIIRAEYAGALELAEALLAVDRHPDMLAIAARIASDTGDWKKARKLYNEILPARQGAGDRAGEAATWHNLGTIDAQEGNYSAARESFDKSLQIEQAMKNRPGEAATLHQLATLDLREGNYSAARENFGKALKSFQAIANPKGEAKTWHSLATIDLGEGNFLAAREKFDRSLKLKQAIGDRLGEAASWNSLAAIDMHEGNYPVARKSFGRALQIRQAIGDRAGEAGSWHGLASLDLREGNCSAAAENLGKALQILQSIGDPVGEAATFYQIGSLAWQRGRRECGIRLVCLCAAIESSIGSGAIRETLRGLSEMATELDLQPSDIDTLRREAAEVYKRDRGAHLVSQAFEGI